MVKNTTGGKGNKSFSRKLSSVPAFSDVFRESESELELYAIVIKLLGNGMCYVVTNDHEQLLCHIRNKFSGRSKRFNVISVGSHVLIGLREWENPSKTSDLLEIYSEPIPELFAGSFPIYSP
jgi:translation initiation factor IF-1